MNIASSPHVGAAVASWVCAILLARVGKCCSKTARDNKIIVKQCNQPCIEPRQTRKPSPKNTFSLGFCRRNQENLPDSEIT